MRKFSKERTGFKVVLNDRNEASPRDTYAIGIRGFNRANRYAPEVVEAEVVDLAWVQAKWFNAHRRHGISLGKGLIDFASGEGFAMARAEIRNPKVLKILEQLTGFGFIETLALHPLDRPVLDTEDTPLLASTEDLIRQGAGVSYDSARAIFPSVETSNLSELRYSGLTNATVGGLFRLK